jgi:hypothetical protein
MTTRFPDAGNQNAIFATHIPQIELSRISLANQKTPFSYLLVRTSPQIMAVVACVSYFAFVA